MPLGLNTRLAIENVRATRRGVSTRAPAGVKGMVRVSATRVGFGINE
jgi:hypothetical protein